MRLLARLLLLWAPGGVRARAAGEMSADLNALVVEKLSAASAECLATYREAAFEAGRRAAGRLQSRLGLARTFKDCELAWRLVTKFSGMSFYVEKENARSVFVHTKCPVLEAGGPETCRNFCRPFVEGLTAGFSPDFGVEVLEEARGARPCRKALLLERPDDD